MLIQDIAELHDAALEERVVARLSARSGLAGALGRIDALALQVARIQGREVPRFERPQALVFAADHGIAQRNVSTLPTDGTRQTVASMLDGRAAVSVLCHGHGLALTVVDCGVRGSHSIATSSHGPGFVSARIPGMDDGSADSTRQIAMTPTARTLAIENGQRIVRELPGNAVLLGNVGVGSSSAAALLMALLTGQPIEQCAGRGIGLDSPGMARKVTVLRMAMQRHARAVEPLAALASVGGLETATMVGAVLQAAHERRTIVVDGLACTAAVAVAARVAPHVLQRCVFAHCVGDPGHARWLERLGVQPLLDLGIRLGDGTGAMMAWPLVCAAVTLLRDAAAGAVTSN